MEPIIKLNRLSFHVKKYKLYKPNQRFIHTTNLKPVVLCSILTITIPP